MVRPHQAATATLLANGKVLVPGTVPAKIPGAINHAIQLLGTAGTASSTAAREAERAYSVRFPSY